MAIYVSSKTFISSRGHNLPWKLKVRWRSEVIRKKVYVCPEPTCIHHNPARALGDLTGMKKHFCRKHRDEKIWNATSAPRSMLLNQIAKHIQRFTASGTSSVNVALIFLCRRKEGFAAHIAMCDALALLKEKEKDAARRALMEKLVCVNHCSFSSLPINNNSALFQEHTSWGTCCNAKSFITVLPAEVLLHRSKISESSSRVVVDTFWFRTDIHLLPAHFTRRSHLQLPWQFVSCRRKEGFAAHIAMCDALSLLKEKEKEVARRALMAKLVSVNHCSFSSLPINNSSALFQELIIKKQPTNPPKLPNLELAV